MIKIENLSFTYYYYIYYVDEKEHKQYVAGLYKLLQNKKFLINFHRDAQKKLEEILNEVQQTLSSNLSNFSYEELLSVYQHFILPKVEQFYIRMWTVFNIAEPLTTVVLQRLQEIVKDRKKAEQYLLILSAAQEANDILQERIELLKLSVLFSKQGRINMKEVEKHTGKYQHIPLFDFDHEHYRKEYFLQELKGVNNPEKELNVIQVKLHHNKEERENKKSVKMYANQQALFYNLERQRIVVKKGYMLKNKLDYHEKGVDVRIATDILRGAIKDEYKRCFVVSSDTDLIPAILDARKEGKQIIYVGFTNFISKALKTNCSKTFVITKKILESCV